MALAVMGFFRTMRPARRKPAPTRGAQAKPASKTGVKRGNKSAG
jgi:hypothetical protein